MSIHLKYIIIEDKRIDELGLLSILKKFPSLNFTKTARNIEDATRFIHEIKPDIVFADIEIPGSSNLEFIRKMVSHIPILIFTSAHPEFALESFELNALDFLLKPVLEERFELTYQRIMEYWSTRELARAQLLHSHTGRIVFKDGYKKIVLPVEDILYLEAMQDYTKIVTSVKKYMVNATLAGFLDAQPNEMFIRIHRSYAVVRTNIKELHNDKVVGSGFMLPIGKTYRQQIARLEM